MTTQFAMNYVEPLLEFINEELLLGDPTVVAAEDDIVLDGTIDSLGVVRIVAFMADRFGIEVPAEAVILENFQSVGAMAAYLSSAESAAT